MTFSELKVAGKAVMEAEDEIAALADELRTRTAERDALAERLRQIPDMRDIVGHLRAIHLELQASAWSDARRRVADLLRRLDRESQG